MGATQHAVIEDRLHRQGQYRLSDEPAGSGLDALASQHAGDAEHEATALEADGPGHAEATLPRDLGHARALMVDLQEAGVAAVKAGPTGREVDAVARAVIEAAGHGEHFGHGLGHGVGMEVHEGPRLSRVESEQPLLAGNVVTVEPGVYLPSRLGVRIEDLLVVREGAQEALNGLDKALTVIS